MAAWRKGSFEVVLEGLVSCVFFFFLIFFRERAKGEVSR